MKRLFPAATLVSIVLGIGSSWAGQHCDVPLAEWQPREILKQKIEAEGWKVTRINTDDGCYKVRAINDKGERLEGKFDPKTLNAVKVKVDHR